jgi:hypothetical protein
MFNAAERQKQNLIYILTGVDVDVDVDSDGDVDGMIVCESLHFSIHVQNTCIEYV